ncbi:MAG: efflux RND transporter permease subunit [Bradymonadia bacterium]
MPSSAVVWRQLISCCLLIPLLISISGPAHGQVGWFERVFKPTEALQYSISVAAPGFAPEEVEQLVTAPLEEAVSAITSVEQLSSTSRADRAQITVRFGHEISTQEAMSRLRVAVRQASSRLPEAVEIPVIFRVDEHPPRGWLVISGGDDVRRRGVLDTLRTRGYGTAVACTPEPQIELRPDARRLAAFGLTVRQLVEHIERNGSALSGSGSAPSIGALTIALPNGSVVRVSDLATIEQSFDPEGCRCGFEGVEALCVPQSSRHPAPDLPLPADLLASFPPDLKVRFVHAPEGAPGITVESKAMSGWDLGQKLVRRCSGCLMHATGQTVRVWATTPGDALSAMKPLVEAARQMPEVTIKPHGSLLPYRRWLLIGAEGRIAEESFAALRKWAWSQSALTLVELEGAEAHDVQIDIDLDREAAARLGVSAAEVARTIRWSTGRHRLHSGRPSTRQGSLWLNMGKALDDIDAMRTLMLPVAGGRQIPLSAVATLRLGQRPAALLRVDQRRAVVVTVWGEAVEAVKIESVVPWPAGVQWRTMDK